MSVPVDPQIQQCLKDLDLKTDPRDDKNRIAASKDPLLPDSCAWILDNEDFNSWLNNKDAQILWIKGLPGKGKTMLMLALEEKLSQKPGILASFFCQNTDDALNNAVAIIKGLIFLLVVQEPDLATHLLAEPNPAWKDASRGKNVLHALWRVLGSMLKDLIKSNCVPVYLMVDALDECVESLSQFLELVTERSSDSHSLIKWIFASRPHPSIDESLRPKQHRLRIELELNHEHIGRTVSKYIDLKVQELAEKKDYSEKLRSIVTQHLYSNSEGTFLWVALVCKSLKDVERRRTEKILKQFPRTYTSLRTDDGSNERKQSRNVLLLSENTFSSRIGDSPT